MSFIVAITGDIDDFKKETIKNLEEYFKILNKYNIKATFPISSSAVNNYPDRAKFILKNGHEIAGHGDIHKPFTQSIEKQVNRLKIMIDEIKEKLGVEIVGFRSPFIKANNDLYPAIKKVGLEYDSTKKIFGIMCKYLPHYKKKYLNGRYFNLLKPFFIISANIFNKLNKIKRSPYILEGILEIPVVGDSDFTLIDSKNGPQYSEKSAKEISKIWYEHIQYLKLYHNAVAVQIHPGRVSPKYLESLDYFIYLCKNDNLKFLTLKGITNKYKIEE